MKRNILVICASARKGGNTQQLCDSFIEGARKAGHTVNLFSVAGKRFYGCNGCETCGPALKEPCVLQDDLTPFYPMFLACDTVVLASPLYMWSISGQLKLILDRLHGIGRQNWADGKHYPVKDCVLLMAAGSTLPNVYDQALSYYRTTPLGYYHWNHLGQVLASGVREPGSVANTPYLDEAYNLGLNLPPLNEDNK